MFTRYSTTVIHLFFLCHHLLISPSSSGPVKTMTITVFGKGIVGVTYRPGTPDIEAPADVVEGLGVIGVPNVRLIDPDVDSIRAFEDSDIDLNISVEDLKTIQSLAANKTNAVSFLNKKVVPFLSKVQISTITVGYGVLTTKPEFSANLLTAMVNVNNACKFLNLKNITVTTSHFFETLINPIPPSSAQFDTSIVATMKQLLNFTATTGGPFQVTLFPFSLYTKKTVHGLTIPFMKFETEEDQYLVDPITRLKYRNMFDLMLDAVVVALAKMGYPDMPIVVSGTGWPVGKNISLDATYLNAGQYIQRLVPILNMRLGSPLRPKVTPVTYIHSLFDDPSGPNNNGKPFSDGSGIWENDMEMRYEIKFQTKVNMAGPKERGVTPVFIFFGVMLTCLTIIVRLRK